MAAPIKLGIIGYGSSSNIFHLPFIKAVPELEIYAFLQRAPAPTTSQNTQQPTKKWGHCTVDYPAAKHYQTSEDFFADKDIEVVIVCTGHDTHASFATQALKSGKHVAVEKPFCRSSEEADSVIALAKEVGKILTVYQNRRWDSDFLTLRKLLAEGALGEVLDAQIHYDFESPSWIAKSGVRKYEAGDGMMFGLGSHSIDQALLLFGPPVSVTGVWRSVENEQSEVDDTFMIVLQYGGQKKNLIVTVKTAVATVMKDQLHYFVRGRKGTVMIYGTCVQEKQAIEGMKATDDGFGVAPRRLWGVVQSLERVDDGQIKDEAAGKYIGQYPMETGNWVGFYRNLANAVGGKEELAVKPEQSRDGLRVIELARKSQASGRAEPWT